MGATDINMHTFTRMNDRHHHHLTTNLSHSSSFRVVNVTTDDKNDPTARWYYALAFQEESSSSTKKHKEDNDNKQQRHIGSHPPFRIRAVNHVNNGGYDDGVDGREADLCRNASKNHLCPGDSLSFAPSLGVAPYFVAMNAKYGDCSVNATVCWANNVTNQLMDWGFNAAGGWTARSVQTARTNFSYIHLLQLASTWSQHENGWMQNDFFGETWVNEVYARARAQIAPRMNDANLVGWWTDNEISFTGADAVAFLNTYLCVLEDGPGRRRLIRLLHDLYDDETSPQRCHDDDDDDDDAFTLCVYHLAAEKWGADDEVKNTAAMSSSRRRQLFSHDNHNTPHHWNKRLCSHIETASHPGASMQRQDLRRLMEASQRWMQEVAWQYHQVTFHAIRAADSGKGVLFGIRYAGTLPSAAITSASTFTDVVDLHLYTNVPDERLIRWTHRKTGKPVLVGEWSFAARDAGLPGLRGAWHGATVATQTERARKAANFIEKLREMPYVIGYAWWQLTDEPSTGRYPDFEAMNYGLYASTGEPYGTLVNAMAQANDKWRHDEQQHESSMVLVNPADGVHSSGGVWEERQEEEEEDDDDEVYAECVELTGDLSIGTFGRELCRIEESRHHHHHHYNGNNHSDTIRTAALHLVDRLVQPLVDREEAKRIAKRYVNEVWYADSKRQAPICCARLDDWMNRCATVRPGPIYEQAIGFWLWPGSYEGQPRPWSLNSFDENAYDEEAGSEMWSRTEHGRWLRQPSWQTLDESDKEMSGRWVAALSLVGAACDIKM